MTTKNIYQKLMDAEANFTDVVKDKVNPYYNSKYEDLNSVMAAVEPALKAENLYLSQPVINDVVFSRIVNVDNPSEIVESSMKIPETITDAQKRCAAVTYFRRTTLKALLKLPCLDDDGNSLGEAASKKPTFTAKATQTNTANSVPATASSVTSTAKVSNGSNGVTPSFRRKLNTTVVTSDDV